MKKQQKWTYPTYVTVSDKEGKQVWNVVSQLYQIGVYIIENNDPSRQGNVSPAQMIKHMKQFRPENLKGDLADYTVEFGREITVTKDENGFYVEVTE
jgi:hypothetical protein